MFKAELRKHVAAGWYEFTPEFTSWASMMFTGPYKMGKDGHGYCIEFEHEDDLISYNLVYTEPLFSKDTIPIMRRVMPTIIAKDILGVSPFNAPDPKWTQLLKDV